MFHSYSSTNPSFAALISVSGDSAPCGCNGCWLAAAFRRSIYLTHSSRSHKSRCFGLRAIGAGMGMPTLLPCRLSFRRSLINDGEQRNIAANSIMSINSTVCLIILSSFKMSSPPQSNGTGLQQRFTMFRFWCE